MPQALKPIDPGNAVAWVQQWLDIILSENQIEALRGVLTDKIMVISGGPGTGKATFMNAVLKKKFCTRVAARVLLAVPIGRATKRLSDATSREARTIHRPPPAFWWKT